MAEELEPWIVATQEGLGKLISKPKMTEKYLKKPPFRFLHDIIMEVCKGTGFGANLYTPEEGDAASLADKSAKVEFLNKAISCVCFALGEKIDVSANKIVAGLEADKTNLWLQKLHIAATTAVDKSDDSVQRVLAGESVAAPRKKSSKAKDGEEGGEAAAPAAPAAEGGDPAADEEAKKAEEKRKRAERKKREAEKAAAEEAAAAAAAGGGEGGEAPPPAPAGDDGAEEERRQKEEARRKKEEDKARREERKKKQAEDEALQRQQQEEAAAAANAAAAAQQQQMAYEQQQQQAAMAAQQQQQMMQQQQMAEEEQRRLMAQQPIQDDAGDGMPSAPGSAQAQQRPVADPGMQPSQEEIAARAEAMLQGGQPGAEDDMSRARPERPRTAGRKPPKVTSKVTTREDGPGLTQGVAPPTIIAEGAKDDDDEDMFEAPVQQSGMGGIVKADDGAPHGKLVQDLLKEKKAEEDKERLRQEEEATREEVEEPGQKGIKMGRLKRKKEQASAGGEIDTAKLSEGIQQLCQAANPLGKSIDLVHQDIANMGKELDHWKQEYREASEQYTTELKNTDELLQPLYQKIAELDDRIAEQKTKIRNSRSRISKNDVTITGLLSSVVMAK